MSNSIQLINDNINVLTQLRDFISGLPCGDYTQDNQLLDSGTIGAHIRHIIEHYDALLKAAQSVTRTSSTKLVIDYDDRARNSQLERHATKARSEIERVCAALTYFPLIDSEAKLHNNDLSQPVSMTTAIRCSTNVNMDSAAINSTLQRELVFLHSHTTHHMAIIRILATALGHNVDKGFGKAASTQQFENQNLSHESVSHV